MYSSCISNGRFYQNSTAALRNLLLRTNDIWRHSEWHLVTHHLIYKQAILYRRHIPSYLPWSSKIVMLHGRLFRCPAAKSCGIVKCNCACQHAADGEAISKSTHRFSVSQYVTCTFRKPPHLDYNHAVKSRVQRLHTHTQTHA